MVNNIHHEKRNIHISDIFHKLVVQLEGFLVENHAILNITNTY